MDSSIKLKRLYNRLNNLYFGGQLDDITVLWKPCDDAIGKTVLTRHSDGTAELAIWIDPKIEALWCIVKETMLHEMAHVAVFPNGLHGKKWKDEMDRLWRIGAFFREKAI